MTTAPNPIQTALQNLGTQLKGDILGIIKAPLLNFFTNLENNPDPQNAIAQAALLQATVLLSGPTLEKEAIQQAATQGKAIASQLPD